MLHRASVCTAVTALWILGSACGGEVHSGSSSGGAGNAGSTDSGGAGSGGSPGSGGAGSGGAPASGGSAGGTTQPASCPNGSSCGGDVVGTWNVTSSCLKLSGDMDVSLAGMGCKTVPVTGSLQVTGTWTAKADLSYTDKTTTTGSIAFPLAPSCLTVSSVPVECSRMANPFSAVGWNATCSNDASGQCNCSATANQIGGIGVVTAGASSTGTYTALGNVLTIAGDLGDATYSYCVSGNALTMTPKPTILPVTGTVVLQKSTPPGTGGAGGAGGTSTGAGGKGGAGGATGSGGKTGSGGATGSGGKTGAGGTSATGGTTATGTGPCDIYAAASNKCVAAHSTIRALLSAYSGPLYQVKRKSDSTTKDIGVLSPGGLADSAAQDTFCAGTTCTIPKVYDQSGNGNFLSAETADAEDPIVRPAPGINHTASSATKELLTVGGKSVYSLYMAVGQAYWRDGSKTGVPLGAAPQGIYIVTSGKHYNGECFFDYGNGPVTRVMSGAATMDSIYFGNSTQWGSGNGTGPWVMADLEGGIYAYNLNNPWKNDALLSLPSTYVTALEKNNGTSEFTLRGGDATTGKLATFYKGKLPNGYSPMNKQGAIILGSGGDCCYSNTNASEGTFYEGAIVAGYPSDATDDAVQANIVSAGYGK